MRVDKYLKLGNSLKVILFITVSGHGRGGHFYSCAETARCLSKDFDVEIVSIGSNRSPVLDESGIKYSHISYVGVFKTIKVLVDYVQSSQAEIINSFDVNSCLFAKIVCYKKRLLHVHTKCGGPSPKKFYPHANSLILYSLEDKEFFESKKSFNKSKIYLIPNRVNEKKLEQSDTNVNTIKNILPKGTTVFLRIARIGVSYKESILQAINLVADLNKKGIPSTLVVIGVVEDFGIYSLLQEKAGDNALFFTKSEFTINASKNISVADFVVGTGRGFMEAALLGKPVLAPTRNRSYPELVDFNNFNLIFKTNFSQRYLSDNDDGVLFNKALNAINEFKLGKEINIQKIAQENFSSSGLLKKYKIVYEESSKLKSMKEALLSYAHLYKILFKKELMKKKFVVFLRHISNRVKN